MGNMMGTTIVAVKKDGKCAVAGDGQVTLGEKVAMKHNAVKVRRLYHGEVVVGFAGSVADAFTLSERFEAKLEQFGGSLTRAAVEAMLIAASKETMLIVSGTGEVIEPDDSVLAIGSGGSYAQAAAIALVENTDLSAGEIAKKAIKIASDICIFTNDHITLEEV